MNQDKLVLGAIVALALGVGGFVTLHHSGSWQPVPQAAPDNSSAQAIQQTDDSSAQTTQQTDAGEAADAAQPTPEPTPDSYEGKVADLPDAARAVLAFEPVDSESQTQSESIANRVYEICGFSDYVGGDDFPGRIRLHGKPHGWTEVTWTLPKCPAFSQGSMTLDFELAHDQSHIKFVNEETYIVTH